MSETVESRLQNLVQHRRCAIPMDFARARGPASEDEAYLWQQRANRMLQDSFGPVAGLKIGCTTPVMRAFLGIDSPAAGEIFASTLHQGEAELTHSYYRKVGVECEIAVRIGRDIEAGAPAPKPADVVASLHAAAEIVDDRYADYKALGINWLIADNFFNAGAMIGEAITDWQKLDLTQVQGRTLINGVEAGRGLGASVMGHPFNALDWLIRRRLASGLGIAAGTIILLGSVVETKWLARGDKVEIVLEGLGRLNLAVA